MLTTNDKKEELSLVYMSAISAVEGFALECIRRDRDSIDAVVRSNKKLSPESKILHISMEVQLKSTAVPNIVEDHLKFNLPMKNYNDLRASSIAERILVVLVLPEDEKDWVKMSIDELVIKKCAYWYSLKNQPDVTNEENIMIRIPVSNILDNNKLRQILTSISKGEELC